MKILFTFISCCLLSISSLADEAPDYKKERLEFAARSDYNAYALQVFQYSLLEEHFKLANDPTKTIDEVNKPLQTLYEMYPLGIQVNEAVAGFLEYAAKNADDKEGAKGLLEIAKKRRGKANAILNSIISSGDGRSEKRAYQVINILEENAVLEHFKLHKIGQSLLEINNIHFDVIEAKTKSGSVKKVYFDISSFYKSDQSEHSGSE